MVYLEQRSIHYSLRAPRYPAGILPARRPAHNSVPNEPSPPRPVPQTTLPDAVLTNPNEEVGDNKVGRILDSAFESEEMQTAGTNLAKYEELMRQQEGTKAAYAASGGFEGPTFVEGAEDFVAEQVEDKVGEAIETLVEKLVVKGAGEVAGQFVGPVSTLFNSEEAY